MRLVTCITLFNVYYVFSESSNPRSVNLALETVLEFDKNQAADVNFIDKVQKFLSKVKNVLQTSPSRRSYFQPKNNLTDLLKDAVETLRKYNDKDLTDAIHSFSEQVQVLNDRKSKLHDFIDNRGTRRFLSQKLYEIQKIPPKIIRRKLKNISKALENDGDNIIPNFLNSIYVKNSNENLKDFVHKLKLYKDKARKTDMNLNSIINDGIRSILSDYLANLNVGARRDIKLKIETYWKNMVNPDKVDHYVFNVRSKPSVVTKTNDYENTPSEFKKYIESQRMKRLKNKLRPKSKFISLYPEKFSKASGTKRSKKTTTPQSRVQTLWRERASLYVTEKEPVKKIIEVHNAVIHVERAHRYDDEENVKSKFRSRGHERPSRYRSDSVSEDEYSESSSDVKYTTRFRKHRKSFRNDQRSDEGMTIELLEKRERAPLSRKYNINDTLKQYNTTEIETTTKLDNMYIKRIADLENELQDVKNKIKEINVTLDIKEKNEIKYDPRKFWETINKNFETTTYSRANKTQEIKNVTYDQRSKHFTTVKLPNNFDVTTDVRITRRDNRVNSNEISKDDDFGPLIESDVVENKTTQVIKIKTNETQTENDVLTTNLTEEPFDFKKMFNETILAKVKGDKNMADKVAKDYNSLFPSTNNSSNKLDDFSDPFKDLDNPMMLK